MFVHEIDLRKPMASSDWQALEGWYIESIKELDIGDDVNPSDLLILNSKISKLYTQARFDFAYIKRFAEKLKRQLKRAERQAYLAVKDIGKNDTERQSLVTKFLEENKVFNYPVCIYDAIDIYEDRLEFIEAVIDDIKSKAERLITINGALKLDAEMTKSYE